MAGEKEAQKKMKDEMGPPPLPIIGGVSSCNNSNDSLIVAHQNQKVNEEGDKTTSPRAAGQGGSKKTSRGNMHIWTERERRKKMKTMFTDLHALLPHLPPKVN